jgi:hypothetical protein
MEIKRRRTASDGQGWAAAIRSAAIGLAVGGVGTQVLMPVIRRADPIGLTPIVVICCLGGAALGWYVRRCASARPDAGKG